MSNKLVCQLNDVIAQKASEKAKAMQSGLNDKVTQLRQSITAQHEALKSSITEKTAELKSQKDKAVAGVSQLYSSTPIAEWRSARPDLTLLVEITLLVIILMMLYSVWPYLSAANSHIFSKEQYLRASMLSESDYSINELGKIKTELQALTDYFKYFDSPPYSPENQGIYDLNKGVIFLPIISFVIIYIVPPFVILYIIWFIWNYWRYVIAAVWGWFLMLYHYGSKLVECKLAEKWYIRMVTGWGTGCPDFGQYFNAWRRQYVDIPVYYEKLKYIQEYYAAKLKYYTIPKRYYIDLPRERYKIKTQYLEKVYVDRATEVFLKKLVDWYHTYYELPRDELYRYLLGSDKNLKNIVTKADQTQKQVRGLAYTSTTPSGSTCTCPGMQTPMKIVGEMVSTDINLAKDDLQTAVQKVKQLYDNIHAVRQKPRVHLSACQMADKVVNNRNQIYFGVIGAILLFFLLLYGYTSVYGTPNWFYSIIAPTWQFVTVNSRPMFLANWWDYSIYLIIAVIMGVIGYGLYLVK
jgi:hypothetical protein